MNDTFMKTRPVFPLLLSMALPNVISMLVNSLYNIVDSLFVAQISEQAMTALSLVFPIQNFVNAVAIGFGIGINAQIALYLGAGDHENANRAATHGMMFSLLHGVLGMALCIAIMPGFLRRFTTDPTLVDMGVTYSTIVFLFSLVNMADLAFEKIFQSVGRMNVAMVALITGCVTNIALDPVLIFGLGPVPALGIVGAALATGIGQAVSLVVYLYVYCTTEVAVRFSRRCLRFDAALDGKLYAIGVPAILNAGHLPERPAGGLLPELCDGAGHLLQAPDLPLPAGQRHRAGDAPAGGLQLRCPGAWPCVQALQPDTGPKRRDHGHWHPALPDHCRPADGSVHL